MAPEMLALWTVHTYTWQARGVTTYVGVSSPEKRTLLLGIAAPGLLAQVIVSKYCDHLPLYRQEQIYARRHGVELPRQTLARDGSGRGLAPAGV